MESSRVRDGELCPRAEKTDESEVGLVHGVLTWAPLSIASTHLWRNCRSCRWLTSLGNHQLKRNKTEMKSVQS